MSPKKTSKSTKKQHFFSRLLVIVFNWIFTDFFCLFQILIEKKQNHPRGWLMIYEFSVPKDQTIDFWFAFFQSSMNEARPFSVSGC